VSTTHLSVLWPIIKQQGQRHNRTVKFAWFGSAWGVYHNMRSFWQCISLLPGYSLTFILLLLFLLLHKEYIMYNTNAMPIIWLSPVLVVHWLLQCTQTSFHSQILRFQFPVSKFLVFYWIICRDPHEKISFFDELHMPVHWLATHFLRS